METSLPPMSPITPGRSCTTGSVQHDDLDGLIRRSLATTGSAEENIDYYEQDNMHLSQEEANKLRDQVLHTFEEVKSKHELVTHLSERLRHIYSSSFLTDSLSGSLGSSVAAPTPDLSSIPHNAPILSPLAIDAQYMERAEKEIARLENMNAEKCKEIEDLVLQMESMRSLHESEREKFRNERVALKSEIVELSVAVRGLRQNNRVSELELEVKKLKAKNYELISLVNTGIEKAKNGAKLSVGTITDPDEEFAEILSEKKKLELRLESTIRERDEFERISRQYSLRDLVSVSTCTEKSFFRDSGYTRDIGIMTPNISNELSTSCSSYSLIVLPISRSSWSAQTEAAVTSVETIAQEKLRMEELEEELETRTSRIGELVAERKALFRTIEDLEDEVSALRENVGMVPSSIERVDSSVECDIWSSDMREKYDKYKRQLLEATKRLREMKERGEDTKIASTMTDLTGEVFDNVVEELQEERDMYRLKLQEMMATKKRECWSQTPEKRAEKKEISTVVPFKLEEFGDAGTQTNGEIQVAHKGVLLEESLKGEKSKILVIENELLRKNFALNQLEVTCTNSNATIARLESDKIALEEEVCKLRADLKANDLSEIIKPLQEKLIVAPSISTCSPPSGGLFDYSHSTIHNQLQQTLSSFSPLRLEMSTPQETQPTPRDKDGDIMMMTVAKPKREDENVPPSNVVGKQPSVDLAVVLKGVRDKAAIVSALSDRICYLSTLA